MRFAFFLLSLVAFPETYANLREPPKDAGQQASHAEQPATARQNANEDKRGTEQSPLVVGPLVVKTIAEKSKDEASNEEKDRAEHADNDRWTIRIGWATFAILTIQAIVFAWQARRLRQSVMEMRTATIATQLAAKAAENQANITRQELVLTQRPKLIVRRVTFDDPDDWSGPKDKIRFIVANVGGTPAKSIEVRAAWNFDSHNILSKTPESRKAIASGSTTVLAAGASDIFEISTQTDCDACNIKAAIANSNSGNGRLICYGNVAYVDDVGTRRETGFLRLYNANRARFEKTNDADYEYED